MDTRTYTINGNKYIQGPLVLCQIKQLAAAAKGLDIGALAGEDGNISGLMDIVGGNLPSLLAVVLTPEGVTPRQKDLTAAREAFEDCPADEILDASVEVFRDFFTFNQVSSLAGKFVNLIKATNMSGQAETGSTSEST